MRSPDPAFLKKLEQWWLTHRRRYLQGMVIAMALFALLKLSSEFYRLLFMTTKSGGIDVLLLQRYTLSWFRGEAVYEIYSAPTYPPASHALLWPFLGLLTANGARWFWTITSLALLIWIGRLSMREGQGQGFWERTFLVLLPLSMNATGVTVGNGQLGLHIIALLWLPIQWLHRSTTEIWRIVVGVGLFLFALVKPSLSAPFFWLLLFSPYQPGWFAALLVGASYLALTLFAAQFQGGGTIQLLGDWLGHSSMFMDLKGYGNLQRALAAIGLEEWTMILPVAALFLFGWLIYRYRYAETWTLLGLTAIFARLWIHHDVYDDLIVFFAMLALYRLALQQRNANQSSFHLDWLVGLNVLSMLAPASMRYFPQPWQFLYKGGHALLWMLDFAVLLYFAHQRTSLPQKALRSTSPQRG